MRCLLWNLKRSNDKVLAELLAHLHGIYDALFLLEAENLHMPEPCAWLDVSGKSLPNLKLFLNPAVWRTSIAPIAVGRYKIFDIRSLTDHTRSYQFIFVHGYDKRNYPDPISRLRVFRQIQEQRLLTKVRHPSPRIVVLGDFNCHPWESPIMGHDGLSAAYDPSLANKRYRTLQGSQSAFMYNPCWRARLKVG
jgi:hypothetical protein